MFRVCVVWAWVKVWMWVWVALWVAADVCV